MTQKGFVLDLDRCTGCAACVVACNVENSPSTDITWRKVVTYNNQRFAAEAVAHYSLACNHCLDPACLKGCPAAAFTKDPSTGAVRLDQNLCMGCRYCTWVCPYDAPRFDTSAGVVEKCTFCDQRLADGLDPACVTACPTEALNLEIIEEPAVVGRPGFPETGIRPAIRITGERRSSPPEMTAAPGPITTSPRKKTLSLHEFGAEWSLWIFTSIMTALVAWFTAAAALGERVTLPVFAAAGAAAMVASIFHLGRPTRAWRGILNVKESWISREAVLVTLFLAGATVVTALASASLTVIWSVAAVGWACLLAMDMVYRVPGQSVPAVPHSAMATVTAAYYLGLLLTEPALAAPAAAVKAVLYLVRRERFRGPGTELVWMRVFLGLVVPVTLLVAAEQPVWVLFLLAVLGELIDRAEFYAGLEFLTPDLQVKRDLKV